MKKLYGSLFLKLLAFVLVCIAAPILGANILCSVGAYESGAYEEGIKYSESLICYNFTNNNLAQVREIIYWDDLSGIEGNDFYKEHGNFAFTVKDSEGKTVFSTLRKEMDFELIVEGYPAREVDETGEIVLEYSMDGYVAKTISENYDGYNDYVRFEFYVENRFVFLQAAAICFAVCAFLCIYLIAASGINGAGETELKGINAVDFDITLMLCAVGFFFLADYYHNIIYSYDDIFKLISMLLLFAGLTAIVLLAVMSISAHFKMKKWWRHTFIYQCISTFGRFFRWFMRNISVTWKLALGVIVYSFLMFIFGVLSWGHGGAFAVLIAIFAAVTGVCVAIWFGAQLKKIKRGGEAIANGDFDYRINSRELWPMLRGHAYNLNCAAIGMSKAVDDRMKSERFKTELITNVSHDLKTPLTSIVSYVDLLKKENIENETALGYIEVIDRQSAKLRKLTEDLVEASKASSGAVAVNREVLDIGELINQSVGEFSEKLEGAQITPVINLPENEVFVNTDGRLLWRVFDNLIQNIIKYAQPGTRAYFDLINAEDTAVLTIKNISKEPLNMTAEALMERFVRGDASRNSEGNGLGLSIAKSLTELCGGTFELSLDGDLYKITLSFPEAKGATA